MGKSGLLHCSLYSRMFENVHNKGFLNDWEINLQTKSMDSHSLK